MARATLTFRGHTLVIRQFEVTVIEGPDAGAHVVSQSEELSIGGNDGNDLQLTDTAVSRHHCVLRAEERGLALRDLGSRNGTFLNDVEITSCYIRVGARIRVGKTVLSVRILDQDLVQPLAVADRAGPILGASPAMRRLYPLVEQCGKSAATVLIRGETGTGKELVAEAIHDASERRNGPFVVIDCSALSHDLAESELFGHERGAFTGADVRRIGAFESAHRGTIFLDEIGELPLALQPLLLRVLENRTIRRVGSNDYRAVDVRVVAASHRDLRVEVNEKRFRADLFYRLNVLRVTVPPLRERDGDIELLASHFWQMFRPEQPPPVSLFHHLASQRWPGNVRELRNAVERAAHLGWTVSPITASVTTSGTDPVAAPVEGRVPAAGESLTYQQAKERAVRAWERGWIEDLIGAAGGNLSRAARAAKMGRSHVRELARRHGIVTRGQPAGPEDSADQAAAADDDDAD
jgi:transcriptional regulator with GAF, ATPase, and Fis domain